MNKQIKLIILNSVKMLLIGNGMISKGKYFPENFKFRNISTVIEYALQFVFKIGLLSGKFKRSRVNLRIFPSES